MRRTPSGFTLLEVLVALLIVTVGLLGFAGTLRPVASLAGEGKARGRAALLLTSRVARLRAELLASVPACAVPVAGSKQHGAGNDESWTTSLDGRVVEIRVTLSTRRSRGPTADTLLTRIPCP